MAKIVITGGAGFIGSELARALFEAGHEVLIIDNLSYGYLDNIPRSLYSNFVCLDIRSKNIVNYISKDDVIFHFAGIAPLPQCQIDAQEAFDVNVGGVGNILDCMRKTGAERIIFSSTSAVYENAVKFPCTESDMIITPSLTYPLTKFTSENLIKDYYKCFGIPYTILRFFNVYGPHQDYKRKHPPFIGYILKCVLNKEAPTFYSSGSDKRDYVYSGDLINLCQLIMKNNNSVNHIFNVASGNIFTVKDIYRCLEKTIGKKLPVPKYADPTKFWDKHEQLFDGKYPMYKTIVESEVKKFASGSTQKTKSLLGWSASTSMEEGLKKCYEFCINAK